MWELHKKLERGIAGREPKTYMMDEVLGILEGIDTESFKASLRILYGNKPNYLEKSPLDLVLMFIAGLKKNSAFDFFEFIRITRGYSKR